MHKMIYLPNNTMLYMYKQNLSFITADLFFLFRKFTLIYIPINPKFSIFMNM